MGRFEQGKERFDEDRDLRGDFPNLPSVKTRDTPKSLQMNRLLCCQALIEGF
jgi:hypothetical protein